MTLSRAWWQRAAAVANHGRQDEAQRTRERRILGAKLSESEAPPPRHVLVARWCRWAAVPGAGFEPAFLGSEASVLPARRSRSGSTDDACEAHTSAVSRDAPRERTRRSSRSGGTRTLTTSIKSRVRSPVTLRTRSHARPREERACSFQSSWDARESNPHPSG